MYFVKNCADQNEQSIAAKRQSGGWGPPKARTRQLKQQRQRQRKHGASLEWCKNFALLKCHMAEALPAHPVRVRHMDSLVGFFNVLAERYVAACQAHNAQSREVQDGEFGLTSNVGEPALSEDDLLVVRLAENLAPSGRGRPYFVAERLFQWILKLGGFGICAMIRFLLLAVGFT